MLMNERGDDDDDHISAHHGPFDTSDWNQEPEASSSAAATERSPHCPRCGAHRIESRRLAQRVIGTLGTVAGAAGAASRTWASVELGLVVGAGAAGPPGAVLGATVGAIAGTVLSALGGAAMGCSLGVRLGDIADTHLLKDLHCLDCQHCFSRSSGTSLHTAPSA